MPTSSRRPKRLPNKPLRRLWRNLSISRSGEHPQMDYVPQGYVAQVQEYLANYQRTREILEEICAINRELLRRRERL